MEPSVNPAGWLLVLVQSGHEISGTARCWSPRQSSRGGPSLPRAKQGTRLF
jgi:hypothetical protein